jgi:hypothetical protein
VDPVQGGRCSGGLPAFQGNSREIHWSREPNSSWANLRNTRILCISEQWANSRGPVETGNFTGLIRERTEQLSRLT